MAKKPSKKGASKRFKIGRIVRVRKDGEDIKFKSYDGEKKVGRYAPLFTLWSSVAEDDRAPLISVSLEANVDLASIDFDDIFCNLYFEDGATIELDADELGSRKSGKTKKAAREDDEDEEESEEDETDEKEPF